MKTKVPNKEVIGRLCALYHMYERAVYRFGKKKNRFIELTELKRNPIENESYNWPRYTKINGHFCQCSSFTIKANVYSTHMPSFFLFNDVCR